MPSLYAEFVNEILQLQTLEDDNSFVTYEIKKVGNIACLKIINMFIEKSHRGKNKSVDLLDKMKEIAYNNKCTSMSAQINKATNDFIQQRTTHICRLYGMEKTYEDSQIIIFSRSI
jgi:hypothetical protein